MGTLLINTCSARTSLHHNNVTYTLTIKVSTHLHINLGTGHNEVLRYEDVSILYCQKEAAHTIHALDVHLSLVLD